MESATPIYVSSANTTSTERRLLLISYHFPPGMEAGALRWQKFAGIAASHGWGIDAFTVHQENLSQKDEDRLSDLPSGTRVYGIRKQPLLIDRVEQAIWRRFNSMRRSWRRSRSADNPGTGSGGRARAQSRSRAEALKLEWRARDAIRAYYALLSYRRDNAWARRAAAVAARVFEPGIHRAVVTCGPPHATHTAGRTLAARLALPYVMDMRDPWSLVERLPEVVASPLWWLLATRAERRCVLAADLVVCNTEPAMQALRALYPAASGRVMSVMNGFDEDPLPPPRDDGCFIIAYAGSIYLDRNPRNLFRAAARVIHELAVPPESFRLEFMGSVRSFDGLTLDRMAREEGIGEYVRLWPVGTRHEAMNFLARAALLVSLPQDSHMAIPSKIFEYMRFDAWLMALAVRGSATAELLQHSDADLVDPNDVEGMARILRSRYIAYKTSGRPRQPALIPACSRAEQARRLFEAIENRVASSRARAGSRAAGPSRATAEL